MVYYLVEKRIIDSHKAVLADGSTSLAIDLNLGLLQVGEAATKQSATFSDIYIIKFFKDQELASFHFED